ncbi:hypothetical protein J2T12_003389 [Paenibacillus anaericanus]|nr:hypothetical protein [Paenibacillus anaericanus]
MDQKLAKLDSIKQKLEQLSDRLIITVMRLIRSADI